MEVEVCLVGWVGEVAVDHGVEEVRLDSWWDERGDDEEAYGMMRVSPTSMPLYVMR